MPISKDPAKRKRQIEAVIESNKRRCGENHPSYGKPRSDETREKLRMAMLGKFDGEKHPQYGKKRSEETCRKMRDAQIKLWQDPEYREKQSKCRRKPNYKLRGRKISEETREKLKTSHIGMKHSEETKQKIRESMISKCRKLSKHPNWKGGASFEPYCPKFNDEFKERVREFFGRKCVCCGMPENDNIKNTISKRFPKGKRLSVHHVKYNKHACCDNSERMFVALCESCHSKTNKNREFWESKFYDIIFNLFGGECYVKNKIPA